MYTRDTTVCNESGLHARPASDFVRAAGKFKSNITICRTGGDAPVNAKSIILLLSLGLGKGTKITIRAEGEDEVQTVDALVALIEGGFGEL
ncbi:MAG: HPr family phosphocarrier protein [Lawsonibacter sp.]|nr:HPr family phosphocarrier protein [Lawsonibacter sp.]